jgi:hypothetical protein
MTDSRIRVSRSLYIHALADAIDWEDSFCASHDPQTGSDITPGHCGPAVGTERCEAYRYAHDLLKRYRRAYAKVTGRQPAVDYGTPVPLHEIKENWPADDLGPDPAPVAAGEE